MKNYHSWTLLCILTLAFSVHIHAQSNSWQFTGGPYFGAATTLVCSASGHVFAGAVTGVFRSTDNGDTWTWVTQSMGALDVSILMIKSEGTIFAGLTDGSIIRSNTNGDSWSAAGSGLPGMAVTDLKQKGTDTVLASTLGGGIYYTLNNGGSWNSLNQGLQNLQVQSLALKKDGKMLAGTKHGLWYSSDDGSHWDTLTGSTAGDVRKIVVDQSDNIIAVNYPSFSGVDPDQMRMTNVYKSLDNGTTWSFQAVDSIYVPPQIIHGIKVRDGYWTLAPFNYPTVIALDQNGNLYSNSAPYPNYISPVLRHTINNGSTWDTVLLSGVFPGTGAILSLSHNVDSLIIGSITSMCFSPNNYMFVGSTEGGIIRLSSSELSSWKKVNTTLSSSQIHSQIMNSDGKLFAMTKHGIFRSSSSKNAWELVDQIHINTNTTSMALNSAGDIFVAYGCVYRSSDQGITWNLETSGMSEPLGPFTIQGMASASNGTLFAGSYMRPVYRSSDNGASWQTPTASAICTTLVAGGSGNTYGLCTPNFFKSTDYGNTWTSTYYGNDLADTTQYRSYGIPEFVTAYEVNDHILLVGARDGVFRSLDTGKTWQNSSQCLPYVGKLLVSNFSMPSFIDTIFGFPTVSAIVGNAQGRIFIGSDYGVYSSIDYGQTWQPYNQGFPSRVSVNAVLIDSSGYLYAGTSDGIVYKTTQTSVGVMETPKGQPLAWRLDQNYPNPFNPATRISYQLSKLSKASLKIYDLLGREVVTLVNEEQSAGLHTVVWDASSAATGVYFYRLQAGSFSQTKKMLLLK